MQGRDYLLAARQIARGGSEPYWRTAVVDAYYALFLECREALKSWGRMPPPRQNAHTWVRLQFVYATDSDLKRLSDDLDHYGQLRNLASYDLGVFPEFRSDSAALLAIADVSTALQLLDAIQADSARQTAAITSLPP